jgi:hypothetical protein
MPCYEVRTVSVEFKVENIDLLKRALENIGWYVRGENKRSIAIKRKDEYAFPVAIDFERGSISSTMEQSALFKFSNQLKRAYSEQVIDEVAKRQKWIKKQMGANQFQLQRF